MGQKRKIVKIKDREIICVLFKLPLPLHSGRLGCWTQHPGILGWRQSETLDKLQCKDKPLLALTLTYGQFKLGLNAPIYGL